MNLNKVFVLGRLTRDPERKTLPSGQPVVTFGLATNRYYVNQEREKQEETEFHNIVIFGKLAETASQYLRKGSLTLIEGRLRTRNWEDGAGQKRYRTEIVAERMQLGPRGTLPQMATEFQGPSPSIPQAKMAVSQEEIPVIEETTAPDRTKDKTPLTDQATTEERQRKDESANKPFSDNNEEIDVKEIPF